jgi:uncharacterized protein YukE
MTEMYADYEGMANNNQQLQGFSDSSATLVKGLANHAQAVLGSAWKGAGATQAQQAVDTLNQEHMKLSTSFADLSQHGTNHVAMVQSGEEENTHILGGVATLL